MSFLDHVMILFGVAIGAFFAGWFVEWLRFGAVLEQHKQITNSLTKQYREIEEHLKFSRGANRELAASNTSLRAELESAHDRHHETNSQLSRASAAIANHHCPTVRIPNAVVKPKKRDEMVPFTSPVPTTGAILMSVREVRKPKKRARK